MSILGVQSQIRHDRNPKELTNEERDRQISHVFSKHWLENHRGFWGEWRSPYDPLKSADEGGEREKASYVHQEIQRWGWLVQSRGWHTAARAPNLAATCSHKGFLEQSHAPSLPVVYGCCCAIIAELR